MPMGQLYEHIPHCTQRDGSGTTNPADKVMRWLRRFEKSSIIDMSQIERKSYGCNMIILNPPSNAQIVTNVMSSVYFIDLK